ncbi:integrin alpha [Rubrivirga sp.]|uniref:integrin alpha n=1 Tax=Rubrivirga sp. TaxID=1885344 RepID=UPI003B51651D
MGASSIPSSLRLGALCLLATVAADASAQVDRFQTISALDGVPALADGDRFGVAAATLGDLDGDGTVEVAVGAYGDAEGRGAVWLLSLAPDGSVRVARPIRLDGTEPGDAFGTALAALGDLDGDGTPELAVGADRDDDGGEDRGAVWVLSLGAAGDVRAARKISATAGGLTDVPADGDLFGHSAAALGDLDGDGVPDLAVGADDADDGGPNRGAVWVLFLAADGSVRQSQRISDTAGGFEGALDDGDLFGQAVAGLGDLDADGTPDLAVAASLDDDGGDGQGAVWVLFLRPDGTVRQHQKISATAGGFSGALDPLDVFGSSLVATGDLDGDGTPDLAVGANRDDDGGPNRGAGWLLFLRSDGTARAHQKLSATAGGAVGPLADGDEWNPTAALGDLDGDGAADLLFGSRLSDLGGPTRGAARVLFTGTAVADEARPPASGLVLGPPFPSPTRGRSEVRFQLDAPAWVTVRVVDALGRVLATLVDGDRPAGSHRVALDGSGWAAGVVFVRAEVDGASSSRPLVVVR